MKNLFGSYVEMMKICQPFMIVNNKTEQTPRKSGLLFGFIINMVKNTINRSASLVVTH